MSRAHPRRNQYFEVATSLLREAGFTWQEERGGKHWKIVVDIDDVDKMITVPGSASDWRGLKNFDHQIRRRIKKWTAEAASFEGSAAPAEFPTLEKETVVDTTLEASASTDVIEVLGRRVTKVEYKGQRVVTLRQIDEAHERPQGTARRQFNANRDRYVEGVDFFDLTSDEIRTMSDGAIFPERTARGALFTERGYGKIVKGWNDDLSWSLHDAMQDAYFVVKGAAHSAIEQYHFEVLEMREDIAWLKEQLGGERNLVPSFDFAGSVTALEIITLAGVRPDQRVRGTSAAVTLRMKDFCLSHGYTALQTPVAIDASSRWRFPREAAQQWLYGEHHGAEFIHSHIRARKGDATPDMFAVIKGGKR